MKNITDVLLNICLTEHQHASIHIHEILATHLSIVLPPRKHLWCNICWRPHCWFWPWM